MASPVDLRVRKQLLFLAIIMLVAVLAVAGWSVLRRSLSRFAGDFLYPYLVSARYVADSLSDQTLLIFSRRELAEQLEILRNENRRLSAQAAAAAELLVENDSLRKSAKLSPPPSWRYTNAEIILRDPHYWNERVTIDRGREHGVNPGAAVMTATPDGRLIFVGVVDQVSRRTAEIVTVYNRDLRISAYLPLAGAVGVINAGLGRADRTTSGVGIGFLPTGKQYVVDEVLLTSGFEQQIPAGIKIGNMSSIQMVDKIFSSTLYLQGTFQPAVQLSSIRFVLLADRDDVSRPAGKEMAGR